MWEALSPSWGGGGQQTHLGNEERSRAPAWDKGEEEPKEVTGMRPLQCHCAQMQRAERVGGKGIVAGSEIPESKIVPEAASWSQKHKSIAGGRV